MEDYIVDDKPHGSTIRDSIKTHGMKYSTGFSQKASHLLQSIGQAYFTAWNLKEI